MRRGESGFDIWSILALVFGLLSALGLVINSIDSFFGNLIGILILAFYTIGELWFYLLTVVCSILSFIKHGNHFRQQNAQWNLLITLLGLLLAIFAWISQRYWVVHW